MIDKLSLIDNGILSVINNIFLLGVTDELF